MISLDSDGSLPVPFPENEQQRLAVLRSYAILDTVPEQAFDDLTLLASQICQMPIATLTLIDSDRQWFKSRIGLEHQEDPRDQSICAHALLRPDELFIVDDLRTDERFAHFPSVTGEVGLQFYAGAPLVTEEGEALGTLCVIDRQKRQLSDAQKEALRALSRQVMAQMELWRNLNEAVGHLAMRVQAENVLKETQKQFESFMDNSPMVAFLKDEMGRYIYVNQPFLRRFEFSSAQVLGRDDFALWPEFAAQIREHDEQVRACDCTLELVESVSLPDGSTSHWQVFKFTLPYGGGDKRYIAGVALDITRTKRYEKQLEEAQLLLENALLQVEAQSLTDGLTGLNNRRAFDRRINEDFTRSQRYKEPLSLLLMDVDNFKSFNDTFGHLVGDDVLKNVALLLRKSARNSDFAARFGGEEFVLILPNTDAQGALILAERFRQMVESTPQPQRRITISIGTATLHEGSDSVQCLVETADKALYQAKDSGRNAVRQAP